MRLHFIVALSGVLAAGITTSTVRAQSGATVPPPASPRLVVQDVAPPVRHPLRLRFGIDGTGGANVRGPEVAMGGVRARLGLQIEDVLAVYYMPTAMAGVFTRPVTSGSEVGLLYNSLMVELTLFDVVQLAAGPSMDFVWGCNDEAGQGGPICDDDGPFFGIDGRLAIMLPAHVFGDRTGIALSADVHPTWYRDDTVGISVLGGMGIDLY